MRFSSLSYFLLLSLFTPTLFLSSNVVAQGGESVPLENNANETKANKNENKWESHESVTSTYTSKFLKKYKYNVFPFQFNNSDVAYSSEVYAKLDSESDTGKSIFIHSVHTFGEEMSGKRAKETLDRYVFKYKSMAKSLKDEIIKSESENHNGYLSRQLYITYLEDKNKISSFENRTAIRINLYATNFAIIEQIVTGPTSDMYSYSVDDFFKSIKLHDGIAASNAPIGVGWVAHTSPNNVFTIKTPPINKDYTPKKPSGKATKSRDRFIYEIVDPVVGKSIYYNTTSYKLNSRPNLSTAREILISNHISKFVKNLAGSELSFKEIKKDGITTYETSIVVTPRQSLPYVSKLVYSIDVKNNFLLVKEFYTGIHHYHSGIEKTFFDLTEFHPEKYKYTPPEKESPEKDKPKEEAE